MSCHPVCSPLCSRCWRLDAQPPTHGQKCCRRSRPSTPPDGFCKLPLGAEPSEDTRPDESNEEGMSDEPSDPVDPVVPLGQEPPGSTTTSGTRGGLASAPTGLGLGAVILSLGLGTWALVHVLDHSKGTNATAGSVTCVQGGCHQGIEDIHPEANLSCVDCHGGDDTADTIERIPLRLTTQRLRDLPARRRYPPSQRSGAAWSPRPTVKRTSATATTATERTSPIDAF